MFCSFGGRLAISMVKIRRAELFLILLPITLLLGCEIDTKVRVTKENPPRFTFSGTGNLAQLYIIGPFTLEELRLIVGDKVLTQEDLSNINQALGGDRTLWRLDPGKVYTRVSNLPAITYGVVPDGFSQIFPKTGKPITLLEGKYNSIFAPSYNANHQETYFTIQDGKAIEISPD